MATRTYNFASFTPEELQARLVVVKGLITAGTDGGGRLINGSSAGQSWTIEQTPMSDLWAELDALSEALGYATADGGMAIARPNFSGCQR